MDNFFEFYIFILESFESVEASDFEHNSFYILGIEARMKVGLKPKIIWTFMGFVPSVHIIGFVLLLEVINDLVLISLYDFGIAKTTG